MTSPRIPAAQEQIEELRQQHIGRLLLRAQRDFSDRAISKLSARGHTGLSLAHTNIIVHLDPAGTRLSTLAERAGVSKQAIGNLVIDLEHKGYISRAPDAADRRATLISFTEAGWLFLRDAHQVKREIEAEYGARLGEAGMQHLRDLLAQLLAESSRALGAAEHGEPSA
jgi:DNA-binding MarR family transcriptional regulator